MIVQKKLDHVRISFSDKRVTKEEFYDFLARLIIKNEQYKTTHGVKP
ncbi:hypothetical protein V7266_03495 [Neobacillus drentensis]